MITFISSRCISLPCTQLCYWGVQQQLLFSVATCSLGRGRGRGQSIERRGRVRWGWWLRAAWGGLKHVRRPKACGSTIEAVFLHCLWCVRECACNCRAVSCKSFGCLALTLMEALVEQGYSRTHCWAIKLPAINSKECRCWHITHYIDFWMSLEQSLCQSSQTVIDLVEWSWKLRAKSERCYDWDWGFDLNNSTWWKDDSGSIKEGWLSHEAGCSGSEEESVLSDAVAALVWP